MMNDMKTLRWRSIDSEKQRAGKSGRNPAESWIGAILQLQLEIFNLAVHILQVLLPDGKKREVIRELLDEAEETGNKLQDLDGACDMFWMYWPLSRPRYFKVFIAWIWKTE